MFGGYRGKIDRDVLSQINPRRERENDRLCSWVLFDDNRTNYFGQGDVGYMEII
jgi:hypothetical protein